MTEKCSNIYNWALVLTSKRNNELLCELPQVTLTKFVLIILQWLGGYGCLKENFTPSLNKIASLTEHGNGAFFVT